MHWFWWSCSVACAIAYPLCRFFLSGWAYAELIVPAIKSGSALLLGHRSQPPLVQATLYSFALGDLLLEVCPLQWSLICFTFGSLCLLAHQQEFGSHWDQFDWKIGLLALSCLLQGGWVAVGFYVAFQAYVLGCVWRYWRWYAMMVVSDLIIAASLWLHPDPRLGFLSWPIYYVMLLALAAETTA